MNIEQFREYCLSLPCVEESTPFDETTLVYKVGGRMFCYTDMVDFEWIAVKCDPDRAVELRERYPDLVTPAYHGNKKHWNGVSVGGELPDRFVKEQLLDSYRLVVRGITPKSLREEVVATIGRSGMQVPRGDL
jgi:predicted DNA-binding protein (MmcQ/YjbR family)